MNFIIFEGSTTRTNLMPLTFVRTVADIRVGISTIREKWEDFLDAKTSSLTETYLSKKYPLLTKSDNVLINGSILPNKDLVEKIKKLKPNQALSFEDSIIAYRVTEEDIDSPENMNEIEYEGDFLKVNELWDIYNLNGSALAQDFERITAQRKSQKLSKSNQVFGDFPIFLEEGAKVEGAMLNASEGPIYIGANAEIMEGSLIRGPFALCEGATVKMGAKIYGATTIGPYSKVGGEVSNLVMLGYSNKVHDGFIGNSVIGEWCNIGAGTSSSNLKNTYDEVKLWSYTWDSFVPTGQQFCGLILGDYSKVAINTSFNTGTVVGIGTTIFGAGFQRNFIPSFTQAGKQVEVAKVIEVAKRMYERRHKEFTKVDEKLLKDIFKVTHKNRLR